MRVLTHAIAAGASVFLFSFFEQDQVVVGHFAGPATVNHNVRGLQVAMHLDRRVVQVLHSLSKEGITPNEHIAL